MLDGPACTQTVTPPDYNTDLQVTTPPIKVSVPVTVKLYVGITMSAGSVDVGTAAWILVRRVA